MAKKVFKDVLINLTTEASYDDAYLSSTCVCVFVCVCVRPCVRACVCSLGKEC